MSGRRGFATILAGWIVAAGVILLAAGRGWGSATVPVQNGVRVHVHVKGHDVAGELAPCAVALLALALAMLASRGWVRRICGGFAAVLGAVVVAGAVAGEGRVGQALSHKAFAAQLGALHPPGTLWPWLAALGGVVAVGCGAVTAAVGQRWSGLGRRYDAPGVPAAPIDDDASRWAALDRGEDPTA
jgi:uncharacterized membrane protein (TIGR02234 family)